MDERNTEHSDRRQGLVEGAFRLIAERGFEGLRLRDVAAAAGIDHSTLHHYFSTKEDLIAEVVDYATRRAWTGVSSAGAPVMEIRQRLEVMARMIEEQPSLYVVLRELDLRATRDPATRAVVDEREQGWRDALTGLLGQIGVRSAAAAAELIIATVKGASFRPDSAVRVLGELGRLLGRPEERK
ncbi:MAG TPA: helix-turn-helix domain-containing protein [Candidatus Dormibacteraeota bacterium]|jgi:AcrR family transcriptional regulator|nr:helix-turn-helix domain-containing protein [Candidatus Dormibacteraeota bacterium]